MAFNDMVAKQRNKTNKAKKTEWNVYIKESRYGNANCYETYNYKPTADIIFSLCKKEGLLNFSELFSEDTVTIGEIEYPFPEVFARMGLQKEWTERFRMELSQSVQDAMQNLTPTEVTTPFDYDEWMMTDYIYGVGSFCFSATRELYTVEIERCSYKDNPNYLYR